MKKKIATGLAAIAAASVALGTCVVANTVNCPSISDGCPDGESGGSCTTTGTKELNTESARGYFPVPSSGNCIYSCSYPGVGTNTIFCGYTTNSWNGYKPGSTDCPGSGG